jgi:hypothetical protein
MERFPLLSVCYGKAKGRLHKSALWAHGWIICGQAFSPGRGVEALVGGDERYRSQAGILVALVEIEDDGQVG